MPEISKLRFGEAMTAVGQACFGTALRRLENLKRDGFTIAHYTTAETALQIIQNRTFWLRNATLMNDYSEIEHGDACLCEAFADKRIMERLNRALDTIFPNLIPEILADWEDRKKQVKRLTYIGSLSEIQRDDELGRLSLWREYGGNAGVALCLNPLVLEEDTSDLSVFHSPVAYGSTEKMKSHINQLSEAIEAAKEDFALVSRDYVKNSLFNAIKYAAVSYKHAGFAEEQEWRMIYSLDEGLSDRVRHVPVSVRGVPQIVCQVPLQNADGLNMPQLDIGNIFERILIGPCEFPDQIRMALLKAFSDHDVALPKIDISHIPLRQR